MSDVMQGPGWWLASDGKWYAPELRTQVDNTLVHPEGADEPQGAGWWLASDGKWYSPALAVETPETSPAEKATAEKAAPDAPQRPADPIDAIPDEHEEKAAAPIRQREVKTPDAPPVIPAPTAKVEPKRVEKPVERVEKTEKAERFEKAATVQKAATVEKAAAIEKASTVAPTDKSAALRYVGFVPEAGDLPEIRPELKVPVARPSSLDEPERSESESVHNGHDTDLLDALDDTDMTPTRSRGKKLGLFGRRS